MPKVLSSRSTQVSAFKMLKFPVVKWLKSSSYSMKTLRIRSLKFNSAVNLIVEDLCLDAKSWIFVFRRAFFLLDLLD